MQQVAIKKESQGLVNPLNFPEMKLKDVQIFKNQDRVSIFYKNFCYGSFERKDKFSRNFFLVQLHQSGKLKLKELSKVFGLGYQQCSNIVVRFKQNGIEGLKDEQGEGFCNRRVIDDKIGGYILEMREAGKSYEEISKGIRFKYRKKIKARSLSCWMYRQKQNLILQEVEKVKPLEGDFFEGEGVEVATVGLGEGLISEESSEWSYNSYAGAMILYSMIEHSGMLKPFLGLQSKISNGKSWLNERILLTLFFLHALRFKSVEQSKHILGKDFKQIVGGDFLRLQWLRYGADSIVEVEGFTQAMTEYFKNMVLLTEKEDKIFYTDGHFSSYYGKRKVPMGWDPRRQQGFKGRNTVFLHNSQGENIYLFESATNTTLSNDIEVLVENMKNHGMELKGKTLAFDRGGYSARCFDFLTKNKLYYISYLKHRKKEALIEEKEFRNIKFIDDQGVEVEYFLFEKEPRESRRGKVRTIILLSKGGRQIPVITTNPYLKMEEVVYRLQRRWREENCFKYMIEHFGVDLLTTYKTEIAPDKIIKSPHPKRKEINQQMKQKKNELRNLESELGRKVEAQGSSTQPLSEFYERETDLNIAIKSIQVEIDRLEREKETIPTKQSKNLKDDHVIISQKRRLLINAIKAMNYNAEKWLQEKLFKYHNKKDETLSMLSRLWHQPGKIRMSQKKVEVELERLDFGAMRTSLDKLLKELKENNLLRMPDGRELSIVQAR